MEETEGLTLRELTSLVQRNLKMVIGLMLVGLVLAGAVVLVNVANHVMKPQYTAQMTLAVVSQNNAGGFGYNSSMPDNEDVTAARNMTQTAAYICSGDQVINAAIHKMGMIGVTSKEIANGLTAEAKKDSQIVVLTLDWNDPDEAVQILSSIADVVPGVLIESLKLGNATVVDSPKIVSGDFSASKQAMYLAVGLLAGIFVAIAILVLRDMMRPKLVDPSIVRKQFGLNLFGTIPEDEEIDSSARPLIDGTASFAEMSFQESYMTTAHILSHYLRSAEDSNKQRPHIIYVTSSVEQEGKSTTVSRLAVELAKEWNVLVVDCDLVNPSIGPMFFEKVDPMRTVNGVVNHGADMAAAITPVSENLSVLPSMIEDDRLFVDTRVINLVGEASKGFDVVLVDTPPVGQAPEAMALNRIAEAALFVIRYDYVTYRTIQSNLESLDQSGITVLGAVVNKVNLRYFSELMRYPRYSANKGSGKYSLKGKYGSKAKYGKHSK